MSPLFQTTGGQPHVNVTGSLVDGITPVVVLPNPVALSVGSPTATTIPLLWSNPVTGGPVASISVFYRLHRPGAWILATAGLAPTTTTYTISGLTTVTAYDVEVTTYNAAGPCAIPAVISNVLTTAVSTVLTSGLFANIPPFAVTNTAITGVTFSGGSGTQYAVIQTTNVEQGSRTSFSTNAIPSITPTRNGLYTIRVYDAAVAGNLIGESVVFGCWATSNGSAGITTTISGPASYYSDQMLTFTGTSNVTSSYLELEIIDGGNNSVTSGTSGFYVPIAVNGTWTFTVPATTYPSGCHAKLIDPVSGTFIVGPNIAYSGARPSNSAPAIHFVINKAMLPGVPKGTNLSTMYAYENGVATAVTAVAEATGTFTLSFSALWNNNKALTPGMYNLDFTLTSGSHFFQTIFVPTIQAPTGVSLTTTFPITTNMPVDLIIASMDFPSGSSSRIRAYIPDLNLEIDGNMTPVNIRNKGLTTAGVYNFNVYLIQAGTANLVCPVSFTVNAATLLAGTALTEAVLTNLTNMAAPGAIVANPTIPGITGVKQWALFQEADYRMAINVSTGAITVATSLSYYTTNNATIGTPIFGTDIAYLFVSDGVNCCYKQISIPIAMAGAGRFMDVGPGYTYATILAAFEAWWSDDPYGLGANTTIRVHYATYQDDMTQNSLNYRVTKIDPRTNASIYLHGSPSIAAHIRFIGIPDPISGKLPFLKYSQPTAIYNSKAIFDVGYYSACDVYVEGFEIARIHSTAADHNGSSQFKKPFLCEGANESLFINKCVIHDCEQGYAGGLPGTRVQVMNSDISFGGEGAGASHCWYVAEASVSTVINTTMYSTGNGHIYKSRAHKNILTNSRFLTSNTGFVESCTDFPNGGEVIANNCYLSYGPDLDQYKLINYGEEQYIQYGINRSVWNFCEFVNTAPLSGYYITGHYSTVYMFNNESLTPGYSPTAGVASRHLFNSCKVYGFTLANQYVDNLPQINSIMDNGTTIQSVTPTPPNYTNVASTAGYTDTVVGPAWWPYLDGNLPMSTIANLGVPRGDLPIFTYPGLLERMDPAAIAGTILANFVMPNGVPTAVSLMWPIGETRFAVTTSTITRTAAGTITPGVPITIGLAITMPSGQRYGKLVALWP